MFVREAFPVSSKVNSSRFRWWLDTAVRVEAFQPPRPPQSLRRDPDVFLRDGEAGAPLTWQPRGQETLGPR